MNERVKQIRQALNLNQSDFASRIGIGQAGLSAIEKGIRSLTERNIQLICTEFNIREEWLRTGNGEMFITFPPEDEYVRAAAEIAKDEGEEVIREIIVEYWKLNDDGKKRFKAFLNAYVESIKKEE